MKIENQACTLEQAKRLKELGITQNSLYYFYWARGNSVGGFHLVNMNNWYSGINEMNQILLNAIEGAVSNEIYSAFTVAELGVMLPDKIPTNSNIRFAEIVMRRDCLDAWFIGYDVDCPTEDGYGADVKEIYRGISNDCFKKEAESRADMLIYLLENKLVTAEDCNKRLAE